MNYGSGLGLTICNEFVNMLKGEINIESTIGVGTKFTIKIPYNYNYDKVILPSSLPPLSELNK
jgi:chemotaxis protein histidine kinase CheA